MPLSAPATPPEPLAAAIVAEAVQRLEREGPLDDVAELQQAFRDAPTRAAQMQARAWLLGQRLGLPRELARWRQRVGWVVLALALLLTLAELGTARAVLAPDRSINAVAAFVTLLGWHALMLGVWLVELAWPKGAEGHWSLGRLALGAAARLPLDRGPHALLLARATGAVLRRARLWPWLAGWVSHSIWTVSFVLILAVLLFGFSFHAYRLTWETTILSAGFFQRFVAVTGALPALLGVPVPDAQAVLQVGNAVAGGGVAAGPSQREWAWWLVGCVACYGLLPRVLLAAFSYWRWRAGQARLAQPDPTDPYVRDLVARLDALEPPPQVLDPERRPEAAQVASALGTRASGAPMLIGFELPPEVAWPPPGLPTEVTVLQVAGSAAERQGALAQLVAQRPAALLLAVSATASPDRGTARFLREASALAGRSALWLLAAAPVPAAAAQRWRDWLEAEGFAALALVEQAQEAMDWVASADG